MYKGIWNSAVQGELERGRTLNVVRKKHENDRLDPKKRYNTVHFKREREKTTWSYYH